MNQASELRAAAQQASTEQTTAEAAAAAAAELVQKVKHITEQVRVGCAYATRGVWDRRRWV